MTTTTLSSCIKSLRYLSLFLCLVLRWTVVAQQQATIIPTAGEYLMTSSNHSTFTTALQHVNILNQLTSTNIAITVIAPTNEEFRTLGYPWTVYLNQGPWIYHLYILISFHLIGGQVTIHEIFDGNRTNITTIAPGFVMPIEQSQRTVDYHASIITGDIAVSNGLVHIPDRVLVPPSMQTSLGDLLIHGQLQSSEENLNFTTFTKLLEFTQMQDLLYLVSDQGLTTMIPIDSAFSDAVLLQAIFAPENWNITSHLVMYHIAPANVFLQRFTTLTPPQLPVQTLNGVTAWFTANNNHVQMNGADFVTGDDLRSNGVAHFIDQFFIPPNVEELMSITTKVSSFSFGIFLHSVVAKGISLAPSNNSSNSFVTIFAPLDSAFADEPATVSRFEQPGWELHYETLLRNHIVESWLDSGDLSNHTTTTVNTTSGYDVIVTASSPENITVEDAFVVVSDLFAIDGLIQGVDKLLVPSCLKTSIYQQLRESPAHSTLVNLIDSVGLAFELDQTNTSALTMLAPSDAVLKGVDPNSRVALRNLLEGHLFQSNLYSNELANDTNTLTALNGAEYMVTQEDGSIFVGSVRLVQTDALASNGVIHTIDHLLNVSSTIMPFRVHTGAGTPWPDTPTTTLTQQESVATGGSNQAGYNVLSDSVYLALILMGLVFVFAILFIFTRRK